jgi:hypothetical protein
LKGINHIKTMGNIIHPAFAVLAFACLSELSVQSAVQQIFNNLKCRPPDIISRISGGFFENFPLEIPDNNNERKNPMKTITNIIYTVFAAFALGCFAFLPQVRAVSPAPDGCYPAFTTAEGCNALQLLTTGAGNTGVGWGSLQSNTTGGFNTGLGSGALILNNGDSNTAVGAVALLLNTSGAENTAVGTDTMVYNDTGSQNTAVGAQALFSDTADRNTAVGFQALYANTDGADNAAVGFQALASNTTGILNTAVGRLALFSNTTAIYNTAIGASALKSNNGYGNTAVGRGALIGNTTGAENTVTGNLAMFNDSNPTTGSQNVAVGASALYYTNADNNTGVGWNALYNNATGYEDTAVGARALFSNTEARYNTTVGFETLLNNTVGEGNTALGWHALYTNIQGFNNTGIGADALALTTGAGNTALGINAGFNLTTGDGNIDIGADVVGVAGESNTIRIGLQGTQTATYMAGISGTPVTGDPIVVNADGQLGTAMSSARFKTTIKPMDDSSAAILALKPVTFRYKHEIDPKGTPQFGLVAEDVEKVNPNLVSRDRAGKPYTVRYEAVNAMLLNEFLKAHHQLQDLKEIVADQQKQIKALTSGLQKVSAQLQLGKFATGRIRRGGPAPQTVVSNQ